MREQLIAIDDRLQPFLRHGFYSFIAPVNGDDFTRFLQIANQLAPVIAISRSVHHALGNRTATQKALDRVPNNIPLRIYVVAVTGGNILAHETVQEYCEQNNIDLSQVMGNPLE